MIEIATRIVEGIAAHPIATAILVLLLLGVGYLALVMHVLVGWGAERDELDRECDP